MQTRPLLPVVISKLSHSSVCFIQDHSRPNVGINSDQLLRISSFSLFQRNQFFFSILLIVLNAPKVFTFASPTSPVTGEICPSGKNNGIHNNNDMTPNIKVIPNDKLFVSEPDPRWFGNGPNPSSDPSWTNQNWLKSRFHFSFAEYRSMANNNFGVLRVMNDDLVQPHRGFGTHPHQNMEIITYIVSGQLTHKDSMGTKESLGRGSIQFMTAGTGIQHSEENSGDTPLRFIQTWISPNRSNLKPNYGSCSGSAESRKNQWHHLVSDVGNSSISTPVEINQDVDGHAAELDLGQRVTFELPKGRQAYLLCIEGGVQVNGKKLSKYDACEITKGGVLEIEGTEVEPTETGDVAHILMFSMKEVPGSGRKDIQ